MGFNSIADIGVGTNVGGAEQQSFLGATIQGFSVSAGFGDSPSQLTVNLVTDGSFKSDENGLNAGVDVYHNGKGDRFRPPPVGTPVFFSFGKIRAKVSEAFVRTIDDYYGTDRASSYSGGPTEWKTAPKEDVGKYKSGNKGYYHFAFGGILQSYHQSATSTDGLRYTVNVVDPREILSNYMLILNNYTGTTFGNSNMMNIYGYLEHNASNINIRKINDPESGHLRNSKSILDEDGVGMDVFLKNEAPHSVENFEIYNKRLSDFAGGWPMTGTGMSRRNSSGIPYYRVVQAFNFLNSANYSGSLVDEYSKYGGSVYFRGLKYALDLSALPTLPKTYMIDYDNLSLLDLCQEICDAANYELFFTLLPIVDGTATENYSKINVGVIKAIVVNKNIQSEPGKIKSYLDDLQLQDQSDGTKLETTNVEIGYELTNEPTDKFVTGGKENTVYYFPTEHTGEVHGMHNYRCKSHSIIPYYGLLGPNTPTIPRGYGSYSQIILDAGSLNAYGVGRYYVTTEIELRAASVSFEKWSEFLLMYNSVFMESIENSDISDLFYAYNTPAGGNQRDINLSSNYNVTVPRCVWPPHTKEDGFTDEDEPINPCSPPYGWPLYWHRALNIGLPQAGAVGVSAMAAQVMEQGENIINEEIKNGDTSSTGTGEPDTSKGVDSEYVKSRTALDRAIINNANAALATSLAKKLGKKGLSNAKLIYNFLKKIADECLGKKYLVQIPQRANRYWSNNSLTANAGNKYNGRGPFGFPPVKGGYIGGYTSPGVSRSGKIFEYLEDLYTTPTDNTEGAMAVNINQATGQDFYNYLPSPAGGFYGYYGAPTLTQRRSFVLEPYDKLFISGSDNRTKCYVRFSNAEYISLSNFPKGSFSYQYLDSVHHGYVPDLTDGISVGADEDVDFTDEVELNGKKFIPQSAVAFVKAELDDQFYKGPPQRTRSTMLTGNSYGYNNVSLPTRKIFDPETCEEKETVTVISRKYYPKAISNGNQSIFTINLDSLWDGGQGTFENGVFALITLPERCVPKKNSSFRDGMNMQVNAANIHHYLQKDVVRGMPGLLNQTAGAPELTAISQIHDLDDDPDGEYGLTFRKSHQQAVRKAYQGLTFDLTNRIGIISPSPIIPDLVAIPLESQERNYGPWTSIYEAYGQIGGKIDYLHDENLTPWTYGGYTLMDRAGKLKAEFGTSAKLMSEKGSFSYPTWPSGLTLGGSLVFGGPLMSDINVSVDANGISTSVVMQTYTQSFGKMQKQRADQLSKLNRANQRVRDINNHLVRRNMAKGQTNASFSSAVNGLKSLITSQDFSDRNYGDIEKRGSDGGTILNLSSNSYPTKHEDDMAGIALQADQRKGGSLQSSEAQNHMHGIISENPVQAAFNYSNTATENVTDLFTPVSNGHHQSMTSAPPQKPMNAANYNDEWGDLDVSNYEPPKN